MHASAVVCFPCLYHVERRGLTITKKHAQPQKDGQLHARAPKEYFSSFFAMYLPIPILHPALTPEPGNGHFRFGIGFWRSCFDHPSPSQEPHGDPEVRWAE